MPVAGLGSVAAPRHPPGPGPPLASGGIRRGSLQREGSGGQREGSAGARGVHGPLGTTVPGSSSSRNPPRALSFRRDPKTPHTRCPPRSRAPHFAPPLRCPQIPSPFLAPRWHPPGTGVMRCLLGGTSWWAGRRAGDLTAGGESSGGHPCAPSPNPPHGFLGSGSTRAALEGVEGFQLQGHHHAVEATQVRGGHHAPVGGTKRGRAAGADRDTRFWGHPGVPADPTSHPEAAAPSRAGPGWRAAASPDPPHHPRAGTLGTKQGSAVGPQTL